MPSRTWIFLSNTFEVQTRDSHKNALSLGVDHKAKLQANDSISVVADMLTTFNPVLQAYLAADQNLSAAKGTYKGKTQTVEELFETLRDTKLPYWEGKIFFFYPEGTDEATELFPNARSPFNSGTYEQRIQSIKILGDKCAADTDLNAVSTDILAFHTQIESARALQQSDGEGQVETLRDLREIARVAMCQEMYGNLGLLMNHFKTETERIEAYFDLSLIRRTKDEGIPINGAVLIAGTEEGIPEAVIRITIPGYDEPIITTTDDVGDFGETLPADLVIPEDGLQIIVTAEKEGFGIEEETPTLFPDTEEVVVDFELTSEA